MIILECDKCGLQERKSYWNPRLIKNIDNPNDYHMFWYEMVSGSSTYINAFPISEFYIEELEVNLCGICYKEWKRFKEDQQSKIKKTYREFMKTPQSEET